MQPLITASPKPEGAGVPELPWGCRGAAHRPNNSWRTNNLTHWCVGSKPSWGASWQCLPCPAHVVIPQLDRAEGAPASQRHRGALWQSPPPHWPSWGRQLLESRGWQAGQALALFLPHAQLVTTQVVVEGLHIGEDTLGIRLLPHDHHVFHVHQGHAVHQHPVEVQHSAWHRVGCPTVRAGTGDPHPRGCWCWALLPSAPLSFCPPLCIHTSAAPGTAESVCCPQEGLPAYLSALLVRSTLALAAGSHPLLRLCPPSSSSS